MTTLTGTAVYRTLAADRDEAIDLTDHWLSQFLDWMNPSSGENYDIEAASVTQDGTVDDEPCYLVRVPVSYTDRTDPDLLGYLDQPQPVAA